MARPRNDVSYNVADVDGIIGKYCLSKVKIFSNLFRTNKDSLKDYLSYRDFFKLCVNLLSGVK